MKHGSSVLEGAHEEQLSPKTSPFLLTKNKNEAMQVTHAL
jgi:hypothetical protein